MKHFLLLVALVLSFSCTRKFYVAPKMADCAIPGRTSCYLIKSDPDENWLMIPEEIYGFEYEEGYLYRIKVKNIRVKDDFNNQVSAYRFVEVLSKEAFTGKKISERLLKIEQTTFAFLMDDHSSCVSLQRIE